MKDEKEGQSKQPSQIEKEAEDKSPHNKQNFDPAGIMESALHFGEGLKWPVSTSSPFSSLVNIPSFPYTTAGITSASGTISPGGLFPSSTPIESNDPKPYESMVDVASAFMQRDARVRELESKIASLTGQYLDAEIANMKLREQLEEAEEKGPMYENVSKEKDKLERETVQLREKLLKVTSLKHIAEKVEATALDLLVKEENFAELFKDGACSAFVVSIDLRQSTTLMLKARDPQRYAMFIKDLCDRLYSAVLANHGVFDKFTGDGVLAFFPDFYSGEDAGFWAIRTAATCHLIFKEEYHKHRSCFSSVLSDVGLGIGIDFGAVNLFSLWGGLTVVGAPVVYACRMAAAPAGTTLLNQPAYEQALEKYSAFCKFRERSIDVKGEGPTVTYEVELSGKAYEPIAPDWPKLVKQYGDRKAGHSEAL
jgi:class 3 adenylate cyclase